MLRKVNTIETLEIPFTVIESQENGIIVDIPATVTYDDEENIISEINPEEYGSPASWTDVNNPLYFDLQIENKIYSWDGKEGTTKIALDKSGVIGRVKYLPFKVNSKILHTKKVITPSFIPLVVRNGILSVDGNLSKSAIFTNAISGETLTLGDVILLRDGVSKFAGIEYEESLQIEE